jgi:hypothetical protein
MLHGQSITLLPASTAEQTDAITERLAAGMERLPAERPPLAPAMNSTPSLP